MSFLAPLFALGAAAVALPILFHLIRRTPRSRQPFSSLMFLTPSPPRLTRRSRLDQLLLLCLRGLILLLLAVAFARPFLREATQLTLADVAGQRLVLLVDVSASMRRSEVWQEAQQQVRQVISARQPNDLLAMLFFDEQTELVVDFETFQKLSPASREQHCVQLLAEREPSYRGTDLGAALVTAADLMQQVPDGSTATRQQIVVISDMQQGASLEQLQAYAWPDEIAVSIRRVAEKRKGNASLRLLDAEVDSDPRPRIRVSNTQDATQEQFTLRWVASPTSQATGNDLGGQAGQRRSPSRPADRTASDQLADDKTKRDSQQAGSATEEAATSLETTAESEENATALNRLEGMDATGNEETSESMLTVQVPAGQSRVIRLARPANHPEADQLEISGDDEPFDNTFYAVAARQESLRVLYLGSDRADDPEGMQYFLAAALAQIPRTQVDLQPCNSAALSVADPQQRPRLVVVTDFPEEAPWEALQTYVAQGGTVLAVPSATGELPQLGRFLPLAKIVVAADSPSANPADAASSGKPASSSVGRNSDRYSLWGQIDFTHPVFADLNSPMYGDFTQVHFWKRIRYGLEQVPEARVLARYDDGLAAFWEQAHGAGSIFVLASGWRPEESQLALSSKFVPLLIGLLEHAGGGRRDLPGLTVGQAFTLPNEKTRSTGQIHLPDGSIVTVGAEVARFQATDQPGIYEWTSLETSARWAVNLPAAESDTGPLDLQQLEAFGVKLGEQPTAKQEWDRQRQLRDIELESRQQLWRWLLIAVLLLIGGETWLATRQSIPTKKRSENP